MCLAADYIGCYRPRGLKLIISNLHGFIAFLRGGLNQHIAANKSECDCGGGNNADLGRRG
jgi:hypothetical protein